MKKVIALLVFALILASQAYAQKQEIELNLRFNAEDKQYEVYAKPSFTKRDFCWGTAQITVVVPANIVDEKLRIASTDGGSWQHNSEATVKSNEFFSIGSSGAKTDFAEGIETLVFKFALPDNKSAEGVRLYVNGKDPSSLEKGMKGGDFANSISCGISGSELYKGNYDLQKPSDKLSVSQEVLKENSKEAIEMGMSVYPNPVTDGVVNVSLKGFANDDKVTFRLTTVAGVELLKVENEVKTFNGKVKLPANVSEAKLILKAASYNTNKTFAEQLFVGKE